jgi:hypothetical protein
MSDELLHRVDEFAARHNLTIRERDSLMRLVARANPPPILYRYRKPGSRTLEEIAKHEIFAARPDDLNDPFEHSAPVSFDREGFRRHFINEFAPLRGLTPEAAAKEFDENSFAWLENALRTGMQKLKEDSGVICFSAVPNSIRMWSYYADAHKGVCVGFDTTVGPFMSALKVIYQNPDKPLDVAAALREDSTRLADHISLRKAAEWDFEHEYRIPIGPIGNWPRGMPYHPTGVAEIRLGVRAPKEFRERLFQVAATLPRRPKLIQMGCDYDRFVLTESEISW